MQIAQVSRAARTCRCGRNGKRLGACRLEIRLRREAAAEAEGEEEGTVPVWLGRLERLLREAVPSML